MKKLPTTKQLTIRYFSIVAIAIITIHYSVLEVTTDDLEFSYVQNRLENVRDVIQLKLVKKEIDSWNKEDLDALRKASFDGKTFIYFKWNELPYSLPNVNTLPYNIAVELDDDSEQRSLYLMKVEMTSVNKNKTDALIVFDNELYERSEEQVHSAQVVQIAISIILTVLSLLVVVKISERLTLPISNFAKLLSTKKMDELDQNVSINGLYTSELEEFVNTFNSYQSRIQELIERERSFNRYASHELRSPLMVIQGVVTLLGESNSPWFVEKQRKRLDKAAVEMSEFIETLLSLTRPVSNEDINIVHIDERLIKNTVESHSHLLAEKPITLHLNIQGSPKVNIPEAALQILLGNLLKNAFAYTEEGKITIDINEKKIEVIDTGRGYKSNPEGIEGYGLGLLLVGDICRRFGLRFNIQKATEKGTIATVDFIK